MKDIPDQTDGNGKKIAAKYNNQIEEQIKKVSKKIVHALGGEHAVINVKISYIVDYNPLRQVSERCEPWILSIDETTIASQKSYSPKLSK